MNYKIKEQNHAIHLREAIVDTETGQRKYPVTLITQGMGNLRDKNYYSAQAIQSGAKVYEGKKCFFDHPTETEEAENPNRSVKELVGHFESVTAKMNEQGLMELAGYLVPVRGKYDVNDLLEHAIAFRKRYPDKHFVGLSINGDGAGKTMAWKDFIKECSPTPVEMEKIKQIQGEEVNVITELTDAVSCDMVTEPGAGGGIKTKESNLKRREKMFKAMRKLLHGVETGDKKVIEQATKEMEAEAASGDDAKAKEAADAMEAQEMEEAKALSKHMAQAKKNISKETGESDEAHEARVTKAAMKAAKKEAADKKAAAEAAADKDGDGDKEKKEKKAKKEADAKAEADAAALKLKEEQAAAANKGEVTLATLQTTIEAMSKKIEEIQNKAQEEVKVAQESAAKANTELTIAKRESMIESKLAKCGLSRKITEHWKPVIMKAKDEKDMDSIISKMKETAERVMEEQFQLTTPTGLVEHEDSDATGAGNDEVFGVKAE